MADLGSAMPTSGGLYWWTHYFSAPKYRNCLSFLVGYSNTLGLVGGLCSIDYGAALMFLSLIVIARDGEWAPSNGVIYAVFLGIVVLHAIFATTLTKIMNKLQSFSAFMQLVLIIASVIALLVGSRHKFNDGHFIFATAANLTTWPTGWAWFLAWLSPIWTIGTAIFLSGRNDYL
jgi:amino acid transporter